MASEYITSLRIRTPTLEQSIGALSGGNQQKTIIARWLATNPRILLLDEPTLGIDIGAKAEIHALIAELAEQGMAIIMVHPSFPKFSA